MKFSSRDLFRHSKSPAVQPEDYQLLFKRKPPQPPQISNSEAYVSWYLRYSEDVAPLRNLYNKKQIESFVQICTQGALKVLSEHPTGDDLFDHVQEIASSYKELVEPLVSKSGGLKYCEPNLQGTAVGMSSNMLVGIEFLRRKYKHKQAVDLFDAIDAIY